MSDIAARVYVDRSRVVCAVCPRRCPSVSGVYNESAVCTGSSFFWLRGIQDEARAALGGHLRRYQADTARRAGNDHHLVAQPLEFETHRYPRGNV